MRIRKGSLVQINKKATGIFAPYVGKVFKADDVVRDRGKVKIVIAGIGLTVDAVDYMGPQGKKDSKVRVAR